MNDILKLITVDDEYLIRNLIKNCISWEESE
jgi:YesN/AraC family two-component response regulator